MATFKHISSKNANYGAAEQYLTFEHDEFTIACMRSNLHYGKNQKREDVKSHHYIISFDPRDAPDNGLNVDRAQALGEEFCKTHFPGHQALVCTHSDGHNHSGNIHVHIVINSLRIAEVPLLPYMERAADTREGCKHRYTDAAMEYFKAEVMEMCHRENLYQIDLLHGSKNRVTEREYWAKRKGQAALDKENASQAATGEPPKQTKFETDKEKHSLCLAGNGPTKIARMLTEQGIPTPGTLEYRRTGSTRRYHPGYECRWATNTVVHIHENREYTGCLVNFKTEKVSYKVKQSRENPVEKQAVFENHHETIIDRDTWERVQELRRQRKRPNRYDEVGLFSGLLFCADCGNVMYQQRYQTEKRRQDCYICGSYKKRTADCTVHFIRTDLLTEGVTENLRKVTSYAAKHEARFMKLLTEQTEDGSKRRNAAKKKELEAAEKRIAELSAIFKRLYEDSVTGRISDERFTELSADYEAEQKELKEKAAALQGELSKTLEVTANAEKFMKVVRKYTSFEELTPTLLREFVEKIVIHESEAPDGKRRGKLFYTSFTSLSHMSKLPRKVAQKF